MVGLLNFINFIQFQGLIHFFSIKHGLDKKILLTFPTLHIATLKIQIKSCTYFELSSCNFYSVFLDFICIYLNVFVCLSHILKNYNLLRQSKAVVWRTSLTEWSDKSLAKHFEQNTTIIQLNYLLKKSTTLIPKFIGKGRALEQPKQFWKRRKKQEEMLLHKIKSYYIVIVINAVQPWLRHGHKEQWNRWRTQKQVHTNTSN